MKANYGKRSVVIQGKGKEWSDTSTEYSNHVSDWLKVSHLTERELSDILKSAVVSFEVVEHQSKRGIALLADGVLLGEPLFFEKSIGSYEEKEFIVDIALFFFCVQSKYASNNKSFEKAIKSFFTDKSLELLLKNK